MVPLTRRRFLILCGGSAGLTGGCLSTPIERGPGPSHGGRIEAVLVYEVPYGPDVFPATEPPLDDIEPIQLVLTEADANVDRVLAGEEVDGIHDEYHTDIEGEADLHRYLAATASITESELDRIHQTHEELVTYQEPDQGRDANSGWYVEYNDRTFELDLIELLSR